MKKKTTLNEMFEKINHVKVEIVTESEDRSAKRAKKEQIAFKALMEMAVNDTTFNKEESEK